MKKFTLKNGIRVIHVDNKSNICTIHASVLVGSSNENSTNEGISHVIEHMLFEGTKNRSAEQIAREVEQYGAEMNAYTSTSKTVYHIKIKNTFLKKAAEVLSDMLINPLFDKKLLKKEKNVILEEINMINDQPRHYQWIFFEKALLPAPFSNAPYGSAKRVKAFTTENLKKFHAKYYCAKNTIITVTGKYSNLQHILEETFGEMNKGKASPKLKCTINNQKRVKIKHKKNLTSEYMVLGYQVPKRNHPDSYPIDVIRSILARGQSGRLFVEVRTKRGLTYNIGVYHDPARDFGFFACHTSADSTKIKIIEKIIQEQLDALSTLSKQELKEAITFIEGNRTLSCEDSQTYADMVSFHEECGDALDFNTYLTKIKKVTKKDILRVRDTYLNDKYTKIILKK